MTTSILDALGASSGDDLTPMLLAAWQKLIVNRSQPYAVQQKDGSYRWVEEQCTRDLLAAHLRGEITLALASADAQGGCKWVCLDADTPDTLPQLVALRGVLMKLGMPGVLEASRRGGHLWLFFAQPVSAREALLAVVQALALARPRLEEWGLPLSPLEVYPSTGAAGTAGTLAHAMRLPLGVHRLTGERYPLLSATGKPIQRPSIGLQLRWLLRQPRIRLQAVQALGQKRLQTLSALPPQHARLTSPASLWTPPAALAVAPAPVTPAPASPATVADDSSSAALAEGMIGTHSPVIRWVDAHISPLDLLAEYFPDSEMKQAGRGYLGWCPFHDDRAPDDRGRPGRPSFYVVWDRRYGWSWRCLSTNCMQSLGPMRHAFRLFQLLHEVSPSAAIRLAAARWPLATASPENAVPTETR